MHRTLISLAAASVLAGSAAALAGAQDDPATNDKLELTIKLDRRSLKVNDTPPRGPSAADVHTYAGALMRGGRPAGRLFGFDVAIDPRYEGVIHTMTLSMADGQVTAQGGGPSKRVPGGEPITDDTPLAIVGGTGTYAGERGTFLLHDKGRRITLTFAR